MGDTTEKTNKKNRKKHNITSYIKKNKITFITYVILRAFVVLAMIISLFRGNFENLYVCSLSLILFLIPAFVEKNFKIDIPSALEILILLFIFAAEILGELQNYYIKIPYWDTMLHTVNGFMFAAVGFALVDIINRNERFKFEMSPMFLVIVSFCFSMTVGILWEFLEFSCDFVLHTDMQKDHIVHYISSVLLDPNAENKTVIIDGITDVVINGKDLGLGGYVDIGLYDTMKDLFVNLIGAIIFNILGFFYLKFRSKRSIKFMSLFVPTIEKADMPDIPYENNEEKDEENCELTNIAP